MKNCLQIPLPITIANILLAIITDINIPRIQSIYLQI